MKLAFAVGRMAVIRSRIHDRDRHRRLFFSREKTGLLLSSVEKCQLYIQNAGEIGAIDTSKAAPGFMTRVISSKRVSHYRIRCEKTDTGNSQGNTPCPPECLKRSF